MLRRYGSKCAGCVRWRGEGVLLRGQFSVFDLAYDGLFYPFYQTGILGRFLNEAIERHAQVCAAVQGVENVLSAGMYTGTDTGSLLAWRQLLASAPRRWRLRIADI